MSFHSLPFICLWSQLRNLLQPNLQREWSDRMILFYICNADVRPCKLFFKEITKSECNIDCVEVRHAHMCLIIFGWFCLISKTGKDKLCQWIFFCCRLWYLILTIYVVKVVMVVVSVCNVQTFCIRNKEIECSSIHNLDIACLIYLCKCRNLRIRLL